MARRSQVSSLDDQDNPEDLDCPEGIEAGTLTIRDTETQPEKIGNI